MWRVNGQQVLLLGPSSSPHDTFPTEPLNVLVQSVILSENPLETYFVAYLWFNTERVNVTSVSCESAVESRTISMERKING